MSVTNYSTLDFANMEEAKTLKLTDRIVMADDNGNLQQVYVNEFVDRYAQPRDNGCYIVMKDKTILEKSAFTAGAYTAGNVAGIGIQYGRHFRMFGLKDLQYVKEANAASDTCPAGYTPYFGALGMDVVTTKGNIYADMDGLTRTNALLRACYAGMDETKVDFGLTTATATANSYLSSGTTYTCHGCPPAKMCKLYNNTVKDSANGSFGWYLGCINENILMNRYRDEFDSIVDSINAKTAGTADRLYGYYWSSNEYSATNAWFVYARYGPVSTYVKWYTYYRVRPVSASI